MSPGPAAHSFTRACVSGVFFAPDFISVTKNDGEWQHLRPAILGVITEFYLSGGEVAALVLLDACVRLIPGVMGKTESGAEESFESGLLEYPHYTRPREWEGRTIPDVLLNGDHARIAKSRREQAETLTRARRPDLLKE